MPNTVVKLTNAESTWLEAAWEDRKLLINEKLNRKVGLFTLSVKNEELGMRNEEWWWRRTEWKAPPFYILGLRQTGWMGHKGGRSGAAALARPCCRCFAPGT